MYDLMYLLFPCFLLLSLTIKAGEFPTESLLSIHFAQQPECIDYFNILT
jgi:hypothetical protein